MKAAYYEEKNHQECGFCEDNIQIISNLIQVSLYFRRYQCFEKYYFLVKNTGYNNVKSTFPLRNFRRVQFTLL